jgi:hypothetical protein
MVIIVALIMLSFYRTELLASLWNGIIGNTCEAQDSNFINGIPSYRRPEDSDVFNIKSLDQLLQLNGDNILSEVLSITKNTKENIISVNEISTLKSIINSVSGIVSARVIVCQPGVTITDNNGPFRFIQRYCHTLEAAPNDVGLNLGGYNVKWEPRTSMIWDSTIRQTIWNHTKFPRIIIMIDLYRPLPLLQHMGSKLVHHLCASLSSSVRTSESAHTKITTQ